MNPAYGSRVSAEWAGAILLFAATAFWLAWFLMPDAATNEARQILEVVREHRRSVLLSVSVQLTSSVAFVPAVLLISRLPQANGLRVTLIGASLLLVGAMGMCADAIFHLVAYYMTADGVAPDQVYPAMVLMQTEGIRFLIPLLLAFFVGSLVLSVGLERAGIASRAPKLIFGAAVMIGIAGGALVAGTRSGRREVALLVLGLFALGLSWLGAEVRTSPRRLGSILELRPGGTQRGSAHGP